MATKEGDIKICMLGSSAVGKTCLVHRFIERDNYNHNKKPEATVGASVATFNYIDTYNNEYKYMIWDTAGQERFSSLMPMYYREASIVFIVYDVTNKESWEQAKYWYNELYNYPVDAIVVFLGNKYELTDDLVVDINEIEDYCNAHEKKHYFCSAAENINIEDILSYISRELSEPSSIDSFLSSRLQFKDTTDLSKDRYHCYNPIRFCC